jgi:hypothetical protein
MKPKLSQRTLDLMRHANDAVGSWDEEISGASQKVDEPITCCSVPDRSPPLPELPALDAAAELAERAVVAQDLRHQRRQDHPERSRGAPHGAERGRLPPPPTPPRHPPAAR